MGKEEGTTKFKYMKSCCQIRIKNENASIWKMENGQGGNEEGSGRRRKRGRERGAG